MIRHQRFGEIKNLDQELDFIIQTMEGLIGKEVTELPAINTAADYSKWHVKDEDGKLRTYMKAGEVFLIQKVDGDSKIYWAES